MACRATSNCSSLTRWAGSGGSHLVAQSRIDALATQAGDCGDGIRLVVGVGQEFGQSRHVVLIAQGAEGTDRRPADLALAVVQQIDHCRPGRRIAPLGQGRQQAHLGLRAELRQQCCEAARGLRTFHFVADLFKSYGADILVLVGDEIAHRLHQIVIRSKRGRDLRPEGQDKGKGSRGEKGIAADVHGKVRFSMNESGVGRACESHQHSESVLVGLASSTPPCRNSSYVFFPRASNCPRIAARVIFFAGLLAINEL